MGDNPNSIQIRLFFYTVPAMVVYMFGFPAFIMCVLRKNNESIREDQILRAHELGDVESENPYSLNTRRKYDQIYYHFKPGKTYWMVCIILRKFFIALIGVLLQENSGFQLSITMLLMFVCYLAQQRHRPYMSSMERNQVIANHNAKVQDGSSIHQKIASHIHSAKINKEKRLQRENVRSKRKRMKDSSFNTKRSVRKLHTMSLDSHLQLARVHKRMRVREYFFDYNTVESFLLACSILVCLAGIMIESGDFTYPDGTDKPHLAWQRDLIGFLVTVLVCFSMLYYLIVFSSELGLHVPVCLLRALGNSKGLLEGLGDSDESGDGIELSVNPIHGNEALLKDSEKFKTLAMNQAELQNVLLAKLRDAQFSSPFYASRTTSRNKAPPKKKIKKHEFSNELVRERS